MTAPDNCPFHDLDPATTVWVDINGWKYPYSAEIACSDYHVGVAMQSYIDGRLADMYTQILEDQP
jgi:hypothetical protein